MTDLRKAAEMALEALDWRFSNVPEAITALRQALAQPTKSWVGLNDKDFEYQPPQTVLTMKFAEAILRDRNE
jgi:hypothetical protein